MPSTNRKRIKEVYFYQTESGNYKIDLIDGRNNIVKEQLYYNSRSDINNFIESLQDNKNTKFEVSKLGMKIYNRKPEQRMLTKSTENIFDIYVNNLNSLNENAFYRHKVAKLLRNVSDILDGDAPQEEPDDSYYGDEPEVDCGCEPTQAISPGPAITSEVPMDFIMEVQESLDTTINLENLTFWFQDQKFQLVKDGFDEDLPAPMGPKTSHNILGTLEYISNLLGVNAERNTKIGENSIRFVNNENVYKIKHIYTGDYNTKI